MSVTAILTSQLYKDVTDVVEQSHSLAQAIYKFRYKYYACACFIKKKKYGTAWDIKLLL